MRFPAFFFKSRALGGESPETLARKRTTRLSFLALGVVFGDIGTSPLYAMREALAAVGNAPAREDVLGVLSLVIWALILVICFKYQIFVLRADNRGDGGIIALVALLRQRNRKTCDQGTVDTHSRRRRRIFTGVWVLILGTFGASLLYGDGMITPAISVLSAVEGLRVATPSLDRLVIPITVIILFFLFWFQRRGTAGIARWFAPIMALWFSVLAALGLISLVQMPAVLAAFNPEYAIRFFMAHKEMGYIALGSVFLAVTGGEVLYADLGHFGARPIRMAWFVLVFPALIFNYLGQGALALRNPQAIKGLFFALVPPGWGIVFVYLLIVIATVATVIASQAAISGAFSLMGQSISLNISPRVRVERTSRTERGQIYIPSLNTILMVACIVLVLGFRTSANLAGAYGVAISTDMLITTILMFLVMRRLWHWSLTAALGLTVLFLSVDIPFWGANMIKLDQGGWVPILIALVSFTIMRTWTTNRERLVSTLRGRTEPLAVFLDRLGHHMPPRVPGTAVFLTAPGLGVPPMLEYHLRHNQVLHEQVLLLSVITTDEPLLLMNRRLQIVPYGYGVYGVNLYYGFKQEQWVLRSLEYAVKKRLLKIDFSKITFYFGRETLVPSPYGGPLLGFRRWLAGRWRRWRGWPEPSPGAVHRVGLRQALSERMFVVMHRNAMRATDFFKIPEDQTVEIGMRLHATSLSPAGTAKNSDTS